MVRHVLYHSLKGRCLRPLVAPASLKRLRDKAHVVDFKDSCLKVLVNERQVTPSELQAILGAWAVHRTIVGLE